MNQLQKVFEYQAKPVRTVVIEGEPWFVAKDVCEILGLDQVSRAMGRLDEDERGLLEVTHPQSADKQIEVNGVSEPGLYQLVLASTRPEAKAFKRWITHEVIPSIRKHGIYATDNVIDQILNNPDFGIELLTKLKEERKARLKAEGTVAILSHVNKTYTSTEIAKELGLKSAQSLNTYLHESKVQYKHNDTWVLYSDYANKGYVEIKQEVLDNGRVIYHRRWTQLGREFLLRLNAKGETA